MHIGTICEHLKFWHYVTYDNEKKIEDPFKTPLENTSRHSAENQYKYLNFTRCISGIMSSLIKLSELSCRVDDIGGLYQTCWLIWEIGIQLGPEISSHGVLFLGIVPDKACGYASHVISSKLFPAERRFRFCYAPTNQHVSSLSLSRF